MKQGKLKNIQSFQLSQNGDICAYGNWPVGANIAHHGNPHAIIVTTRHCLKIKQNGTTTWNIRINRKTSQENSKGTHTWHSYCFINRLRDQGKMPLRKDTRPSVLPLTGSSHSPPSLLSYKGFTVAAVNPLLFLPSTDTQPLLKKLRDVARVTHYYL